MASVQSFDVRNPGVEFGPETHHFPRWMDVSACNFDVITARTEKASRFDKPLTLVECSVILWIIGIVMGGLAGYIIGRSF